MLRKKSFWYEFFRQKFDEKYTSALILPKLGAAYVSEVSKKIKKKKLEKKMLTKNRRQYFFLENIFFLESSDTYEKKIIKIGAKRIFLLRF